MLTKLRLENFRCFADHQLPLRERTLIVGSNNAGKSTIVLALRLLSIVTARYRHLNFIDRPTWTLLPLRAKGVSPSLKGLEFESETLFHRYGDPPAVVTANFSSGHAVRIFIGANESIFAEVFNPDGESIRNKSQAIGVNLPIVGILPQIRPLEKNERSLSTDYVKGAWSSYLASGHFRNQLNLLPDSYEAFKALSEETWPGLRIRELLKDEHVRLQIQDNDFVAEVGNMGHGLQMWLQTLWFLASNKNADTLILDEPDVYLHADLQRKLIRLLKSSNQQMIIATHSVEMMAEVDPDEVLVVDKKRKSSKFANTVPSVQRIIDRVGGIHNINLARLSMSKKCLLLEGQDVYILRHFHNTLFPKTERPLDALPIVSIGGWGGWNYAIGSSLLLQNAGGEDILSYCIFDADYRSAQQIDNRYVEAAQKNVNLHVWSKKELENYVLVPRAIYRYLVERGGTNKITVKEIENQLIRIADYLKDDTFDSIASEYHAINKGKELSSINKVARETIENHWKTTEGKLSLISGKKALGLLSEWTKERVGISLGAEKIAKCVKVSEIDPEIKDVLTHIEKCKQIPNELRSQYRRDPSD